MDKYTKNLPTPCYVVDEELVEHNLMILKSIMDASGCKILLAQKAFSMFSMYPLLSKVLCGTTASGLYEARLGKEEFEGEVHVFSPAYKKEDMSELLSYCDHIIFNSISQYEKFAPQAKASGKQCGLRLNPQYSTGNHGIYDPCRSGSRLGVTLKNFNINRLSGIDGFHIHTLCEQNSDDLERTMIATEEKFGAYFHLVKWLNLGGGHHITRSDYDIPRLLRIIKHLQDTYQVKIYLEPGEAVVLNSGFLVTKVLDIVDNDIMTAILDTSAACHMPDVLEMPYRPEVLGAKDPSSSTNPYVYRLAGPTCLSGDIIGDYSFPAPLKIGSTIIFCDMALYSMVKNNTFNGMPLPAIAIHRKTGENEIIKTFGYQDFKMRLS
ncbi:carboxynorspermidine decarboxylase, putative [Lachnospiraceae bacterium KM106-2]|nr:carboxynorspermidine decarboxylase, putative [Lachnospiraceae bacterium KM106-2]